MLIKKLTQLYSHYPCEKPLVERFFVKSGQGLIQMRHRNNYDWMLFLTSPMAFVGARTHNFVFTKRTLQLLNHGHCMIMIVMYYNYQ